MKKTIVFRVDAGKVWGTSTGHIKRALLLLDKLKEKYNVVFIMKDYPDGVGFVKKQGVAVSAISTDDNSDKTLIQLCEKYKPEKLIIDLSVCSYISLFEYTLSNNIKTIIFDVVGSFSANADILINDSFVREFTAYPEISSTTKKYIGPKYFIMEDTSVPIPPSKAISEIMVTMGGSDPAGLTVKIINSLPEVCGGYTVNVVLGPLFTEQEQIRQAVHSRAFIHVYNNPPDFIRLLCRQDLVITAAGRTLYESAFFGKPVITVPSIEHEAITSREYACLTGSIDIGLWHDKESPARLAKAIDTYQSDPGISGQVYEKSRSLVDGCGLRRVLEIIG